MTGCGLCRSVADVLGRAALRSLGWNTRRNALGLSRVRLRGAACPAGYDGATDTKLAAIWANRLRSGQLVGSARGYFPS